MIQLTPDTGVALFGSHLERLEKRIAGTPQDWFLPTRRAAFAHLAELGFPTTRHEDWLYTSVAPIVETPFEYHATNGANITRDQISPYLLGGSNGTLLVFINGFYAAELSSPVSQSDGLRVRNLRAALDQGEPTLADHLSRYATHEHDAFTALNTALMEDGAFIHVPKGLVVTDPLHMVFVSAPGGHPIASHPRILIIADAGTQASIVETHVGINGGTYFTNPVTELIVGEDAVINHYKVDCGGSESFHVSNWNIHQGDNSTVNAYAAVLGGRLVRNCVNTVLGGAGCECTVNGLYIVADHQHVDNHLIVDHAEPRSRSREAFKGVLNGHGRGVFTGRIIVREDAQQTDAKQTNMSLLLSEEAQVQSRPQLEILADDVKCTHGATVGQVDEEAVFYLCSRGLDEEAARSLLVYAFANDSIASVRLEPLRQRLTSLLLSRLPQGGVLREAI